MRDLLLGPRRYTQLLESLTGITTNLLARRLKDMQGWGLITKTGKGPQTRYQLTADGADLEPAIMELARWGGRYMNQMGPLDRRDLGWALLSRKRVYQGGEQHLRVGIHSPSRSFELVFSPQNLTVREHEAIAPDLEVKGEEAALFGFLFQGTNSPSLQVLERHPGALDRFRRSLQIPDGAGLRGGAGGVATPRSNPEAFSDRKL